MNRREWHEILAAKQRLEAASCDDLGAAAERLAQIAAGERRLRWLLGLTPAEIRAMETGS